MRGYSWMCTWSAACGTGWELGFTGLCGGEIMDAKCSDDRMCYIT